MRIGVELNGVLRDTLKKIQEVYTKWYVENPFEETKEFDYEVISDCTTLNITEHLKFKDEDELYNFMYKEYTMEIFGHAPSSEMNTFNELNDIYVKYRDKIEFTIISDEISKSKPATLFFLSKFGCLFERIIFFNELTKNEILNDFDLIVTSNPDIIINYNNKVVKYETDYNKKINSSDSITKLNELDEIISKLEKC